MRFPPIFYYIAVAATHGATGATLEQARELYAFSDVTFIENIAIRPNGHLILSTMAGPGRIYTLDPSALNPELETAGFLPDAADMTGIAEISPDKFVMIGGYMNMTAYRYVDDKYSVYVLDFEGGQSTATVRKVTSGVGIVNGITALPGYPDVVLGADSANGQILRIDVSTGDIQSVFQDTGLGYLPGTPVPLGVNGIKVFRGSLYYTNSALGTFGRIQMSADGQTFGSLEVLATLQRGGMIRAFDDFDMSSCGTAYVSVHENALYRIYPNGTQAVVIGGDNSTLLKSPTSAAVSRDGTTVYVVTGGISDGAYVGGQVVKVEL